MQGDTAVTVRIPAGIVGPARRAAEQIGVSEVTFYYAVTLVALSRLTGEARVASTFQSAGRRSVEGSDGVMGCFSNGLVLAPVVDPADSIAAFARRLRGEIRAALAHEAFPYHHVIRATGVSPAFGMNWFPRAQSVQVPRPGGVSPRHGLRALRVRPQSAVHRRRGR